MAKASNPFSDASLRQRFSSDAIARKLIAQVVYPQIEGVVDKITGWLTPALAKTTDGFFKDVATNFMGQEADLTYVLGQEGGLSLGDIRAWMPLTENYVKRKGGDRRFWIYVQSTGRKLHRKKRNQSISWTKNQWPLIRYLNSKSGLSIFGAPIITVSEPSEREVYLGSSSRGGGVVGVGAIIIHTRRSGDGVTKGSEWEYNINVKLWPKVVNAKMLANIEKSFLAPLFSDVVDKKGRSLAVIKLMNDTPWGSHRPLIRPMMAYYGQVVFPQLIREVLDTITGGRVDSIRGTTKAFTKAGDL